MTDAIVITPIDTTNYVIGVVALPDPISVFWILIGFALWFVLVSAFYICRDEHMITNEISSLDVNLTLVSFCFLMGSVVAIIMFYPTFLVWDYFLTTTGTLHVSICDNNNNCRIAGELLQLAYYLSVALVIWFVLNVIQMIGEFIDFLQERYPALRGRK